MIEEAIERVQRMEKYFDRLQEVVSENPHMLQEDEDIKEMLHLLVEYYEGGQWLRDYELDEQGMFPEGLKRGVLAEDSVYDFLSCLKNEMC